MNVKASFLFFSTIFVAGSLFAQNKLQKLTFSIGLYHAKPISQKLSLSNYQANFVKPVYPAIITQSIFLPVISPNYYTQNFGFFCKKELQWEKATKIPFKFRLGSVEQCDRMEGKVNAGIR